MRNLKRVFVLSGLAIMLFGSVAFAGDSASMNLKYQDIEAKAEGSFKMEQGIAKNGETVQIPGEWADVPQIIVSPNLLGLYNSNFGEQSQKAKIQVENIKETSPGRYSFRPVVELQLDAGTGGVIVNEGVRSSGSFTYSKTWTSQKITTAPNVSQITASISYDLFSEGGRTCVEFKGRGYCVVYKPKKGGKAVIRAYLYIDGQRYTMVSKSDSGYDLLGENAEIKGTATKTVSVNSGQHEIYVKAYLKANGGSNDCCGDFYWSLRHNVDFKWVDYSTNMESSSSIAEGSISWTAVGEGAD